MTPRKPTLANAAARRDSVLAGGRAANRRPTLTLHLQNRLIAKLNSTPIGVRTPCAGPGGTVDAGSDDDPALGEDGGLLLATVWRECSPCSDQSWFDLSSTRRRQRQTHLLIAAVMAIVLAMFLLDLHNAETVICIVAVTNVLWTSSFSR